MALKFPRHPEVGRMDELHPETENSIRENHDAALASIEDGDNAETIERLWELVGSLLAALQIEETTDTKGSAL